MLTSPEILTSAQMRAIESATVESGKVTGLQLMERAGAAVVEAILDNWPELARTDPPYPWRATVLCGPGNNGGDGFVVARLLAERGWELTVLFHGDAARLPPDARHNHDRWREIGDVWALQPDVQQRFKADVLVDALFGLGLSRPVDAFHPLFFDMYEAVNNIVASERASTIDYLVALDIPSFLSADSGRMLTGEDMPWLTYDLTVTFHRPKIGHLIGDGPELCGKLAVADIGLQGWFHRDTKDMADTATLQEDPLRKRPSGHKYDHGHALVLAGGAQRGGAARLSARTALRAGAGLVTICPPGSAMADLAGLPDALMRHPIEDAAALQEMLADKRITALCLGPGAGFDRALALLPAVLSSRRRCVLDADALTALADDPDLMGALHAGCVLTPHMGEFTRLFPDLAGRLTEPPLTGPGFSKLDAAREAAARSGTTVLLKGPDTVIAGADGRAVIHSAFDVPWLATAGSGDVLAGLITGLLARGLQPLRAAETGVLLLAAAARRFGPGLIADDLPEQIPGVFRDLGL